MAFVLIAITLCVGWLLVEVDPQNLIYRAPYMARTLGRLVDPDFSTFAANDPVLRDSISGAMMETIFMALLATLLGFVIAFPISFLGARNLMGKGPIGWAIYTLTRAFFNIFRSVEVLIWAIIFAVWVSFGPFAGVIALAIHTVAALGKLYSEQVESIDPGPVEAMTAVGARRWQIIIYGIIPQIIPSFMAFTMYRWDINVRMSTIIGLVGGGGIGRMLFYYKNELDWEKVGAVVIAIIAVVWTMDYISGRVRERIA
jgi:phosphonate transport system permease protein